MNSTSPASATNHLPFFVYGTLLPGQPNAHLWGSAVSHMHPATLPNGRLFDMGSFPMLLMGNGRPVTGMLVEVIPEMYDPIIRSLDALEKYDPAQPQKSVYRRIPQPIQTAPKQQTVAWVYVGSEVYVAGKPEIPGGDWSTYVASRLPDVQNWWHGFTSLFPPSPTE
ncbi:MAG: gamma-glutamylcyclotransferase [Anaerolineales bacterium]|nr:gamma-glutamylcyclotransferase [Anaerolineales bacterium]